MSTLRAFFGCPLSSGFLRAHRLKACSPAARRDKTRRRSPVFYHWAVRKCHAKVFFGALWCSALPSGALLCPLVPSGALWCPLVPSGAFYLRLGAASAVLLLHCNGIVTSVTCLLHCNSIVTIRFLVTRGNRCAEGRG